MGIFDILIFDMSLSNVSEMVFPENQYPALLKKFRHAIKRVEHGTNDEPALTEQELIGMVY